VGACIIFGKKGAVGVILQSTGGLKKGNGTRENKGDCLGGGVLEETVDIGEKN